MKNFNTGLDNKRIFINMVFGVLAFLLNTLINFFLAPYITGQFGSEAYGYIKLATDFTAYTSLFSIALNSMASRFIMLEREQEKYESANEYYSSLMMANILLAVIIGRGSFLCVLNLEKLIAIPIDLVPQVKITFAIVFLSFIISLLTSIYSNCYYLTNRLDLNSIHNAISTIIRVSATLGLFVVFKPRISYVVLGTLIATVYLGYMNYRDAGRLMPDMKVDKNRFNPDKIRTLFVSGIWNSLTKLSQIFSSGLDLLITNILVGSKMMGYLSIAKTVPGLIVSFNATIANVFSPNLMILYSKDDLENLKKATKSAMRFMCLFVSIPNAILITMGIEFFRLWVPGQPAELINILSILTIINSSVTGPAQPLYQIFTITNKVKESSIVMILYGFSSIIITYMCLKFTPLGVYAVAGVSLVGSVIVALVYHIPFAAKYIGLPKSTFLPEIGLSILSLSVLCVMGYVVNYFFDVGSSWFMWIFSACITGAISLVINMALILSSEERKSLFDMVKRKILRLKSRL